ncbi:DinB family protein [Pseudonocardia acaciae]|uniref:DinB family protein n=1 Tax=Pseudonocardia acaciae TaxID=551276 RepID=UPI00048EA6F2|nr:DinB family protein [Pseudonocardia acaciae]
MLDWNEQLVEQLDWHWRSQLRPRMDTLTDREYLWEPAPGAWSVRPRGTTVFSPHTPAGLDERSADGCFPSGAGRAAPMVGGSGEFTIDFAFPEPDPPPVTTIAWRMCHLIVGVFGMRVAGHFGGPAMDYDTYDYPGDAAGALSQLDQAYAAWAAGVRGLGADGLSRPCGPAEGPWADHPMATLVLHINREVIHHGAEIALLRDLYRHHNP